MVLHQYPVVQHGHGARFDFLAFFVELWHAVNDVVGVPLATWHRGHGQGYMLLVYRGHLAIDIGIVIVVVNLVI